MARSGMCSRREAERLIEAGSVEVDGERVREQGTKCSPKADIQIVGRGQRWIADKITVLLHKPLGVVSTQPEGNQLPAWKLLTADRYAGEVDERVRRVVDHPYYLNVAGRLDRDSQGLLVLTSDGLVVRAVTGSKTLSKVYQVTVDRHIDDTQLHDLSGEIRLDGKPLERMKIKRLGRDRLRFELKEGKRHQIRRVCRLVGLEVTELVRSQVGPWHLGDLREGRWKLVPQNDVAKLLAR
jgi:23S rRNA pseudouridine2604 synthase